MSLRKLKHKFQRFFWRIGTTTLLVRAGANPFYAWEKADLSAKPKARR